MYGPMYSREIIFHYREIKYKSLSKAGKLLYVTGSQKISCLISFMYLYILIVLNPFLKNQSIRVNFRELEKQRQITCKSKFQRDFFFRKQFKKPAQTLRKEMRKWFLKERAIGFLWWQNNPCQIDCALSLYRQRRQEDVLYFPGSALEFKPKIDSILEKKQQTV